MALLRIAGKALKRGVNRQRIGMRRRGNAANLPFILQDARKAFDIAEVHRTPVKILNAIKEIRTANKAVLDAAVLAKRKGLAERYDELRAVYRTHLDAIKYLERKFEARDRRAKASA